MSVTEQPSPPPPPGDPREALHDRIAADSLTTRRDYLRIVATVSGGLAVGGLAVAGGILPRHGDPEDDKAPAPKQVSARLLPGESVSFRYPEEEDRAVAVRLNDGTLVGYSAICTHLACAVLWQKDRGSEGELYCPCHEGVFDARTGEVTAGPPPRGLPKVVLTEQTDGSVWAVGTTRSGESIEHGLCRQLGDDRPDLASRIGCPGAGTGAEGPKAAGALGADGGGASRASVGGAPRAKSGGTSHANVGGGAPRAKSSSASRANVGSTSRAKSGGTSRTGATEAEAETPGRRT